MEYGIEHSCVPRVAWETIPKEEINRLIRSMLRRLNENVLIRGALRHDSHQRDASGIT